MMHPKTTIAGYLGLLGTVLAAIGSAAPTKGWGQMLLTIGIGLGGAMHGIGNIASADGRH